MFIHSFPKVDVTCSSTGEFLYPDTWLQCSDTITCADPGMSTDVNRKYVGNLKNLQYKSELKYACNDKRSWIKFTEDGDGDLSSNIRFKGKLRQY